MKKLVVWVYLPSEPMTPEDHAQRGGVKLLPVDDQSLASIPGWHQTHTIIDLP